MNGLQSLMQGAPTQQPQQPQQAPAMPNDPRMGAAMGLVDDSVEKFNLDPQTEALMLKNQALDLLKAADNVGKMNVPQQDTNIQEQTEQGIAGMLQRLAPGMQQRGQQMQRSQARQMLGGGAPARPPMPQQNMARPSARPPMGGMPAMGAPNMARMANGGIVGYAGPDGSQVQGKPTPTLGAVPPSAVGDEQIKQFAEQYTALQAGLAAATTPQDKARSQQLMQDLIRDMGNEHAKVMQYIDSTKGFVAPRSQMARGGIIGYSTGGRAGQQRQAAEAAAAMRAEEAGAANLQAARNRKYAELIAEGYTPQQAKARASEGADLPYAMLNPEAQGGDIMGIAKILARQNESPFRMQGVKEVAPVGTQYDPDGTESLGLPFGTGQDTFDPPVGESAAPQEFTPDALDLLAEKKLTDALSADPDTVAKTRGDRLRELTGFDDLMARRIESEKAVREQKESRLTPEETRKRRVREGLARLAEQGLGGFGAGRTAEMDKIAAERLGIEETSLADLNSLIAEKRAMGMTQFEAENSARAEIQGSQDNAATAASRRAAERRAEFVTERENRLNRQSNERVAKLQVAGSNETDLVRRLNIRMKEIKAANPELSETEIASRAMNMVEQQETSAALARVGIQASQQDFARYEGAARIVIDRLTNDIKWATLSTAEQQKAYETALDAEIRNIERIIEGTSSAGGTYPPMPTERSQLVRGTIYSTSQGNARWNGTSFIPVN